MLKQIRFKANGCCSAIGNFEPGDVARIDDALAAHLVDEAKVADYVATPKTADQPEPAPRVEPRAKLKVKRKE